MMNEARGRVGSNYKENLKRHIAAIHLQKPEEHDLGVSQRSDKHRSLMSHLL
jgi:hypothetical protein